MTGHKVHLVDGTYELFRAYYGPPGGEVNGREIGAARNLVRSMVELLREKDVSHVVVCFDSVIESFRNELFDGYKTGDGIEPALKDQFELAEEGCRALGLTVWGLIEFEADDGIAAGAARWRDHDDVERVVCCSPDKDLYQSVREGKVITRDRMRRKQFDVDAVKEKMGVPPALIPDYLALVGDSADGIPGVPKWGAKSSAALLNRYGGVEHIPDDETTWDIKVRGAAGLAENLRAARDVVGLYKTLATLREDVPIQESLDDIKWTGPDAAALDAFLTTVDDHGLKSQLPEPS